MGATARLTPIVILIVIALSSISLYGAHENDGGAKRDVHNRPMRLPPLFDFARYKQIFHKHYGSLVEELSRRALFIPRVLKIVASGLRYMCREQEYHLAVNRMTDYTPNEIERMWNKHQKFTPPAKRGNHKLVKRSAGRFSYARSLDLRDLINDSEQPRGQNQVDSENLVQRSTKNSERVANFSAQIQLAPYEIHGSHLPAFMREMFYESTKSSLKSTIASEQMMQSAAVVSVSAPKLAGVDYDENNQLQVDHSLAGCIDEPRDQGECGACWAFVGTAMHEWLQCQKSGKLVRFSEQYAIDCAGEHLALSQSENKPAGCSGGSALGFLDFVRNFGVELRRHYAYEGRQLECPLSLLSVANEKPPTEISETGHFRFDADRAYFVPQELWSEYLYFGPLYVFISTANTDFVEYGHGVHELRACNWSSPDTHALQLVGQGKQNGLEYWKLRNSFSVGWGEQGYYRVSKRSAKECFNEYGGSYLTEDGENFWLDTIQLNVNHQHNWRHSIKASYWQRAATH